MFWTMTRSQWCLCCSNTKFLNLMKQGIEPVINGDGSFSRDFTYIENVVQANVKALFTQNEKCYGEAFNIGAGGI